MNVAIIVLIVIAVLAVAAVGLSLLGRRRSIDPGAARPNIERGESGSTATLEREAAQLDVPDQPDVDLADVDQPDVDLAEPQVSHEEPESEKATFRDRLGKARTNLSAALGGLRGRKVDEDTWEELEEALILADVGVPTTMRMLGRVRERAKAESVTDTDGALSLLREEMEVELGEADTKMAMTGSPAVWLFVGVNGVGKTTTIGKLAKRETDAGRSVVLAAGDTFRAAAAEQLETWANRCDAGFIRGAEGADPGSVVFDAVEHAASNGTDLVLADTAGRLHNKTNLMEELRKVRRVAEKGAGKVSEVILVIDATTGQNGLAQAKQFTEAVDVTGIALTKLDGSAKGGIVLAIQAELDIPVKLVGLGEGIGDLVEFEPAEFVDALFA